MENKLVRYSRAGDTFHYRWAARRCLRMLHPKSLLYYIIIEGSNEREMAGEYVIDMAEYFGKSEDDIQNIHYYQLKHTTVRKELPFNISDLKDTIVGFAKRFKAIYESKNTIVNIPSVKFTIVTNRPITFKNKVKNFIKGNEVDDRFLNTIQKYTALKGGKLKEFCGCLQFIDGEGDYKAQKSELQLEISQLIAGTVDNPQIDSITSLVQEKVMPDSDGKIVREDIYKLFGVLSERDLFPAPAEYEKIENMILRFQHDEIVDTIISNSNPTIIHAAGGVGKSVISRQITQSLPSGSFGIVYDCFGGGRYRNRSEPRHRYRDALIQIANELATEGLCEPLIATHYALEDEILRQFLIRINVAVKALRKDDENSVLAIIIDAADNAEMAASEYGDSCFAHELLRESLPEGCKLVMLCRTERVNLLEPLSYVKQIELKPFSEEETLHYLKSKFMECSKEDGTEFHRLTGGNPRVQSNILKRGFSSIEEVLNSLSPIGISVEEQIELQLDNAIAAIKDNLFSDYQNQVDAICLGLANLPPFIPIRVLAKVTEVNEYTVRSFISELGSSLWLTDNSVQFRDEPTETWFRKRFSANKEQILSYINHLKPMAYEYTYVAEVLPSLLLQAEQYNDLINLTLYDQYLPEENPIDRRNVKVYRLQFAFKAALKSKKYDDSIKLALLAGEEMAGDKRQLKLIKENIDLLAPLQSEQRIRDLAFRGTISNAWDGSQNVYSASLLSSVSDFKGEARGYLRAGLNWLNLYFEERKSKKDYYHDELQDEDILELVFAYFNLFGPKKAVDFLLNWRPNEVIFRTSKMFIRRIIDLADFNAVYEMLRFAHRNQYFVIATVHELLQVKRIPEKKTIELCLDLLSLRRTRINKPNNISQDKLEAIVSFLEVCAVHNLSTRKILRVLRHYFPSRAPHYIASSIQSKRRDVFLRVTVLKSILLDEKNPNIEKFIPEQFSKKDNYENEQNKKEFIQVMEALLPWYIIRLQLLLKRIDNPLKQIEAINQQSKKILANRWKEYDTLPHDISKVAIDILLFSEHFDMIVLNHIFLKYIKNNNQIRINDLFKAVRAANRLSNLTEIKDELEEVVYETVSLALSEDTETRAEWYVQLSRAVLPVNRDDAAAYFDYAIDSISRFGDEIVQRWEAIIALGKRSAKTKEKSTKLGYRFIRCAELIGDNVEREKYFDRNEAIRVCARLSPTTALASLSRWRDRGVGWFDRQLPELAKEIVSSNQILPIVAWSLSTFMKEYESVDFATVCLEKEQSKQSRQYIFDKVIRDIRLNNLQNEYCMDLNKIAIKYNLNNNKLNGIKACFSNELKTSESSSIEKAKELEGENWDQIFLDLDLASNNGIKEAINRFWEIEDNFFYRKNFWEEMFSRVKESDIITFLKSLINVDEISIYSLGEAFSNIPQNWQRKVSFKKNLNKMLMMIGKRFSIELCNKYQLESFFETINLEKIDKCPIYEGIIEGLMNNSDFVSAETFFGFIQIASNLIMPSSATKLLDFGLGRFEMHLDSDFGDGTWMNWLEPPEDISMSFAGFVWSALGSPKSEVRWQAVHCVRQLAEANCEREIDALIDWMENGEVGAFGSNKLPFYKLHARLYLLIGLARVSIDFPKLLIKYKSIFLNIGVKSSMHILIQKYAAEIALNIEKSFPKSYCEESIIQLRKIGKSQLPIKKSEINEQMNEYADIDEEENGHSRFFHNYDIIEYWFRPLGDVFGISSKIIEKYATEVIYNEFSIENEGRYQRDPRESQWRSNYGEEIMHSHGSYPKTDSYNFYLSYHSMFVVAAKLLREKQVVRSNLVDNPWEEWLNKHLLTRKDGYWLADRRDETPLITTEWAVVNKDKFDTEISAEDFLGALLSEHLGNTWLNVYGSWVVSEWKYEKTFHVSSALVSTNGSQSLLNALSSCSNPYDFKLPEYNENNMEFDLYPFCLKGWIYCDYIAKGIDEFDPLAAKIDYPPYKIGESIIKRMRLTADSELRKWFIPNSDTESVIGEIWSTDTNERIEGPLMKGNRLSASLSFLKNLCMKMNCELVIEVQINCRFNQKAYFGGNEESAYKPPINKIFVLSPDGKLRDEETYYEIG